MKDYETMSDEDISWKYDYLRTELSFRNETVPKTKEFIQNIKDGKYDYIINARKNSNKSNASINKIPITQSFNTAHLDCTPRCPICNSTNLSKITNAKKIAKIAAFGIFGMGDNGKTWKCNNCGSKF